ncbi:MAG: hypothetical protein IVW57_00315 [Ktedonobacterales bacterium]|nr:hypothetical protein [Ktedonobacterales bacterium]
MAKRYELHDAVVARRLWRLERPVEQRDDETPAYRVAYRDEDQSELGVKTATLAALEKALTLVEPGDVLRVHVEIEGPRQ